MRAYDLFQIQQTTKNSVKVDEIDVINPIQIGQSTTVAEAVKHPQGSEASTTVRREQSHRRSMKT